MGIPAGGVLPCHGAHTALLYQASLYNPHILKDRLIFTRPKNADAMDNPLPLAMLPWIEEFLASDFPGQKNWYWRFLDRLSKRCGFATNFLRFRHYRISNDLAPPPEGLGLPVPEVCVLRGVTVRTCRIYGPRRMSEIARTMRERGW